MKLLAIDTSTEACSAALYINGEVQERYTITPREHGRLILPMIDELMSEAGIGVTALDAIAFGCGPGAFTGLRIAAAVTQGIAFGAGLPVVPVSSLAALAHGVCREQGAQRVLAAIDARIQEIYWGVYMLDAGSLVNRVGEEVVCTPHQAGIPSGHGWFGAGSGWETYGAILQQRMGDALERWEGQHYPHAQDVAILGVAGYKRGQGVGAEQAVPVYLRDEVAAKSAGHRGREGAL